jgi:hypothetical protein
MQEVVPHKRHKCYMYMNASHPNNSMTHTLRNFEALCPVGSVEHRALTETTLRETRPDLALVFTASQRLVRIDNRVSRRHEVGVAWLQRHSVHDDLHRKVLAVGGHAVLVECWFIGIVLAVFVDQVPEHFVEHAGPDVSNRVHAGQWVHVLVRLRVDCEISGVEVVPDTGGFAIYPCAHRVVRLASVVGLQADGRCVEVTPTLAHAARFEHAQTVGVFRSSSQTVGESMGVLVNYNTSLERAISPRSRRVPHVHAHTGSLAVRWRGEVGVVEATSILSVQEDEIIADTAGSVVVNLEISSYSPVSVCIMHMFIPTLRTLLIESKIMKQIVVDVRSVEQLRDRGVGV